MRQKINEPQFLLNIQRTQFLAEAEALEAGRETWEIELREVWSTEGWE